MDTQNIIRDQQRVGKMLLTDLTNWTKKPGVIAGGAIRDWEMGYFARDIDIYIESNPDVSNQRFKIMLEWMLEDQGYDLAGQIVQLTPETNNPYEESYIEGVFEFAIQMGKDTFDFEKFQVIRLKNQPAEEVIQRFTISTSQAMMLRNGNVMYTKEFFDSLRYNEARFKPNINDAYLAKMVRRLCDRGFTFKMWDFSEEVKNDPLPF